MSKKGVKQTSEHRSKIATALKGNNNGKNGKGVKKPAHSEECHKTTDTFCGRGFNINKAIIQ